jgi:hypothetical protein
MRKFLLAESFVVAASWPQPPSGDIVSFFGYKGGAEEEILLNTAKSGLIFFTIYIDHHIYIDNNDEGEGVKHIIWLETGMFI